jgi:cell division protein FtsZ
MGTATAEGDSRSMTAANRAISSPLLEDASVNGARGVIVNVTGGPDMSLMEVNEALTIIQESAHEDANIIFGAVVDPALSGRIKITVIATGFDHRGMSRSAAAAAAPLQTPVDLQHYASHASARPPGAPAMEPAQQPRMTISRRPALDLPSPRERQVAVGGSGMGVPSRGPGSDDAVGDLELDVPAFLRRSEG